MVDGCRSTRSTSDDADRTAVEGEEFEARLVVRAVCPVVDPPGTLTSPGRIQPEVL
jgi:hypothetical protein